MHGRFRPHSRFTLNWVFSAEASPVLTAHGTHKLGPGATNCLWSHETRRSYRDMRTKRLWTAQLILCDKRANSSEPALTPDKCCCLLVKHCQHFINATAAQSRMSHMLEYNSCFNGKI